MTITPEEYLNTLGIGEFVYYPNNLIVWRAAPSLLIYPKTLNDYSDVEIGDCIAEAEESWRVLDGYENRCVMWQQKSVWKWHLTFPACIPPVWVTTFGDERIKEALLYLGEIMSEEKQ